ncbi:hypothetical protein [Fibrella arboris]|uniref:hypothetical protein n=1 Tax=Fibrella arboris TaxID=3242486 RepID=UPI003522EADA
MTLARFFSVSRTAITRLSGTSMLGTCLLLLTLAVGVQAQTSINIPACANCPAPTAGTTFVANTQGCFNTKMANVSAFGYLNMGASVAGEVYIWGNAQGLGGFTYAATSEFPVPTNLPLSVGQAVKVGSGRHTQAAMTSTGEFYMWGFAGSGLGGIPGGTTSAFDIPYSTTAPAAPLTTPGAVADFAIATAFTFIVTQAGNAYVTGNVGNSATTTSNGNLGNRLLLGWNQIPAIAGSIYTRVWATGSNSQAFAIFEVKNTTTNAYSYYASGANYAQLLSTNDLRLKSGDHPSYVLALDQIPALMDLPGITGRVQEFIIDDITSSIIIKVSNTEYYFSGHYGSTTGTHFISLVAGASLATTPSFGITYTPSPQRVKLPPGVTEIYDMGYGGWATPGISASSWIIATDKGLYYVDNGGTGDWKLDTYHLTDGSVKVVEGDVQYGTAFFYIDVNGFITYSGEIGLKNRNAQAGIGYDYRDMGLSSGLTYPSVLQHTCLRK